jgi:hypothetical protein
MSRREKRGPRAERLRTLLEEGDHAAARAEARAVLAAPDAADSEREAAAAVLTSLDPDSGALIAGALGVAAAIVVFTLTVVAR